jgi:hypothetical protein
VTLTIDGLYWALVEPESGSSGSDVSVWVCNAVRFCLPKRLAL